MPQATRMHRLFPLPTSLTSLVFNGRRPLWCSVLIDPLRDGLNLASSLVLDATFGQFGPLSSFCFLFASLSLFSLSSFLSSLFLSSSRCLVSFPLSIHGFKAVRSHGYSIHISTLSDRLLHLCLEFPVLASSSVSQGVATCPLVNCVSLLRRFSLFSYIME